MADKITMLEHDDVWTKLVQKTIILQMNKLFPQSMWIVTLGKY